MEILDDYEKVTCRICGHRSTRIYGKHLKFKHDMSTDEYKLKFPGAPLMSPKDLDSTNKNSGLHMKQDKYRKMFSEKVLGENNPSHRSKVDASERKRRSPFSKDFKGYNDMENKSLAVSEFAKKALKDRLTTSQKEYWISKGFSEEDSINLVSDRQKTFSLEKCIEKYGDEAGLKKYNSRQIKWQSSLKENGNIKCGYSEVSQKLFWEICESYVEKTELSDVYFATKNKEYFISIKDLGFKSYDFADRKRKKIIEYNGDLYHANPLIYSEYDRPHPYLREKGPSALDIWKKDEEKIKLANDLGFEVLTIWDSEYRENKEDVLNRCLNFLFSI